MSRWGRLGIKQSLVLVAQSDCSQTWAHILDLTRLSVREPKAMDRGVVIPTNNYKENVCIHSALALWFKVFDCDGTLQI